MLDGRRRGRLVVDGHRLYDVVRLRRGGRHLLRLSLDPGVEAYAFTFG